MPNAKKGKQAARRERVAAQFVNRFRASSTYTPEYGGACTGGVGTPLQT